MSEWRDLADWMFADVKTDRGFWYAHPLYVVDGLSEEKLFWVPDDTALCMLWHVGHIAHRERLHIGRFLQDIDEGLIPEQYEVFGAEWRSVDEVRASVDSVDRVFQGVREVRDQSTAFVSGLGDEDWHRVPPTSEFGMTTAQWLVATVAHGAIHIGKLQMLRAMLEGRPDPPC